MQLEIGETYLTRSTGREIKILARQGSFFIGFDDGWNPQASVYMNNGTIVDVDSIYCDPRDLCQMVSAGARFWQKLESNMQRGITQLCKELSDKKITSIKLVRAFTGAGLLEAKQIVEGIQMGETWANTLSDEL